MHFTEDNVTAVFYLTDEFMQEFVPLSTRKKRRCNLHSFNRTQVYTIPETFLYFGFAKDNYMHSCKNKNHKKSLFLPVLQTPHFMTSDSIQLASATVPKIGLGTYLLQGSEGRQSILRSIELGYRHIDTARMYENEAEVGAAIADSGIAREAIFVTTKIWPTDFRQLLGKTEDSLRQLKTDYIDLLLLHWPSDAHANQIGAELLHEAIHKGYVKNVGVSNFTIAQLDEARRLAPLVCNQVEYQPYLSQEKMLHYLREHQLFLTAYRPLARGKVLADPTLQEIAARHGKSISQIVLRWLVQQGDVAVIPKATSLERQQENLDIFDFELSAGDMQSIFGLNRNERLTNPATAPQWD
jgi:2,5-diketo-D-gluconate reductase B